MIVKEDNNGVKFEFEGVDNSLRGVISCGNVVDLVRRVNEMGLEGKKLDNIVVSDKHISLVDFHIKADVVDDCGDACRVKL